MKKVIDSLYNLNNLLNEKFKIPIFSVHSSNVLVIKSPTEFYTTLKELSSNSKKRISISSLYIGTDHLEKELIHSFSEAKRKSPDLDINILLDYNRATRETLKDTSQTNIHPTHTSESSRSFLLPLVNKGAKVNFYLTCKLSGWHRYFLRRQKWNELISLHHMKLYIFDDDIIISGANLSDIYFTNRQDRYVLIRNSPSLCNYFDQLIKTISKFSLLLEPNGSFKLHENWKYDPRKYFHRYLYKITARKEIAKLNNEFKASNVNDGTMHDTIIFPLLQMNIIGIKDEEEFTSYLMEFPWSNSKLNISTGYFNLIGKYQKKLIEHSRNEPVTILMASEEANGFYNGRNLLRYIPSIYTYYVRNFLRRISHKPNIEIRSFDRPNWSFHGKGIWLSDKFYLTMVGSTNLGYRSVFRDNEAQIIILTKNDQLKKNFENEYKDLVHHSKVIRNENDLPKIPFLIVIFARIFRSFF